MLREYERTRRLEEEAIWSAVESNFDLEASNEVNPARPRTYQPQSPLRNLDGEFCSVMGALGLCRE